MKKIGSIMQSIRQTIQKPHKIISLMLLLTLLCSITACSSTESETSSTQPDTAGQEAAVEEQEDIAEEPQYDMTVHFLDVGQGLSILAQSDDQTLIYDGGDSDKSSFVVAYLKEQGVTDIDYLISSHYDSDHVNGLIGCLNAFDVESVICSDYVHDSDTYQSFISTAQSKGLELQHPAVGTAFTFGTGSFEILAPAQIDQNDSNNNSVAIKLTNGDNSFIFTGDAESSSESAMCASGINLDCDVLVPGHHGSATATSWEFLESAVPEYAVISCGVDNQYGHPDKDTMDKLQSMDIQVFRTDKQGTIVASSDGSSITWNVEPCNDYSPGDPNDKPAKPASYIDFSLDSSFDPSSEASSSGQETSNVVYWTPGGKSYHNSQECSTLSRSKTILSGSLNDALNAGKDDPCNVCVR